MVKQTKVTGAAVVLAVKGNVPLRGARQAWYGLLLQYNGKPAAAFLAAATATPPSLPQKGKGAGKAEPASGWLRYFVRQGIASYTNS
jgi:hypothetical protein